MDPGAIEGLVEFLVRQRQKTGVDLPHRHHLLIEHCRGEHPRDQNPRGPSDTNQVIVHTLWGGRINRPFSLALSQGWEEKFGYPLEVYADNDAIMINLAHDFSGKDMVSLVQPHNLEGLLRRRLEKTGFFGARFRECASTSLLLPRKGFNQRVPLWLNRLRAKKLLSAVLRLEDFPILIETWRTCLQDEFDLPHMLLLMDEIQRGLIRIDEVETSSPSPFSTNLLWWQTNRYIYEDDTPQTGMISNLSRDLIRDIALSTRLRPAIPSILIEELTSKLHRTAPGYSPSSSQDLLDWVKERLMIPVTEWEHLLGRILSDHQLSREQLVEPIGSKLALIRSPNASRPSIVAREDLSRLIFALSITAKDPALFSPLSHETPISHEDLKLTRFSSPSRRDAATAHDHLTLIIGDWLRFYGPLPVRKLSEVFGLNDPQLPELLESLQQSGSVVIDRLSANAIETEICDLENLERLLRLARIEARPVFQILGPEQLPLFLATWQGLVRQGDGEENLKGCMEKLFGYPLPVECWERDILPTRIRAYNPAWLDSLISKSELNWIGSSRKRIFFSFETDIHLYQSGTGKREAGLKISPLAVLFPDDRGRYDFWTILDHSGLTSWELTGKLWSLTWAGIIANDTFSALRRGIETRFQATAPLPGSRSLPGSHSLPGSRSLPLGRERVGHRKWESSRPLHGNWLVLPRPLPHIDPLQKEDVTRERISVLLDRYGILFKEILSYELPHFKWAELFHTLRLMELSGEILTGRFFEGIPGIQFIAHSA
ncbi:MAG TPA: ATP-dependent helicase, partial [Spirochaetia bacterium]|nr:ATP-dependent helicase [Spirochaetia bacterium]